MVVHLCAKIFLAVDLDFVVLIDDCREVATKALELEITAFV